MVVVLLAVLACTDEAEVVAEAPAAEVAAPPLTVVRLPPLVLDRTMRHDAELRGLLTMAIELGLSDLDGVLPVVVGDAQPPSLIGGLRTVAREADARFVAVGPRDALEFELELCVAGGECSSTTASGSGDAPWEAMGALLDGAAVALGAVVPPATRAAWRTPGSKDAYAELVTGRAAAMLYGLTPPVLTPGDRKADPVLRAVYLDPGQPLAQWTRARWEAASTVDGGRAAESLAKAQLSRPTSPLLVADQATLAGLTDRPGEALLAWESLASRSPNDPRWHVPLARAYLSVDRPSESIAVLDRLPAQFAWDPMVAELRVAATEAQGGDVDLDPLLARWQDVSPTAVEPVSRRIGERVRLGRYADALALLGALRQRAAGPDADALEVALLVALGRLEDAAALAPADVATALRARSALSAAPDAAETAVPADHPQRLLYIAQSALLRGEPAAALRAATEALTANRNDPQAAALRARALEALGRGEAASAAWSLAWDLDPGAEGGPVERKRIASTFRYVEQGEHPLDAAVDGARVGPVGPEL